MTQLASANRIYQRQSSTGGGQGKGQGVIRVAITASQAGSVQARCRSAADGTTILQGPWSAGAIAGTGVQTLDIQGVDARLGWFYLDLLDNSGVWKQGTTPVGMGALIAVGGQSLMSRFLGRVDGEDSTTLATLGIIPSPFARAFIKYTDGGTHEATAWESPTDAAQSAAPTSAGVAELLNLRIATLGVNCGVIGYAKGATAIGTWQAGQSDGTELATVITNAGGAFESFFWFQGHGDAVNGTSSYAHYQTALTSFFTFVGSLNARSFSIYMAAIPNIDGWNWGDRKQRSEIRKAQQDWCADHGATYLSFADLELTSDNIHERQAGARRIARHLHRAMLAETRTANDAGPRVTAATRSGRDITLSVAHMHGTSLIGLGSPATRCLVTRAGDPAGDATVAGLALDASTPILLAADHISLKLATDPGTVPLEIWPMGVHPDANGAASGLYDDDDAEGFGIGRQLFAETVPIRTRINTPLNTAVSGLVTSYGAGRFGQGRATGEMQSPYPGLIGHPYAGLTMDLWVTPASLSTGGIKVLASQGLALWIGVNDAHFQYQVGDASIASVDSHMMVAGQAHHVRLCLDPGGRSWRFYVDGALQSSGSGTPGFSIGNGLTIGGHGGAAGAYTYTQGVVDEVALFNRSLSKADFTPPVAPWLGTEADLLHLWHCNGDGADSAL